MEDAIPFSLQYYLGIQEEFDDEEYGDEEDSEESEEELPKAKKSKKWVFLFLKII